MSEQTLKLDENVVNKKDFYVSKKVVALDSVESSKILVFEHSENGFYWLFT